MNILVFNPGGNSLKAEIVSCEPGQTHAGEGTKRIDVIIEGIGEGIGKEAKISQYEGKKEGRPEPIEARDYGEAVTSLLAWLEAKGEEEIPGLDEIACVGIRVVHGGPSLTEPTLIDAKVEKQIQELEKLAPLHNKSSIEVLAPIRKRLGNTPIYGVFDTAFHRTLPDYVSHYALPFELTEKHGIRRYGFHGISHRYLLARYAHLAGKRAEDCTLISMHLESGCSVTAIRKGKSVDNTMGLTPLEGLMMGTRCGDLDASILPLLVREEGLGLDEVMTILNKKSGLLGVSGESLDTRILMKQYDANPRVKLALDMFCYRVRKAVGASVAALGDAEAIVFGGGIGENMTMLRERVGEGLRCCGLQIDAEANRRLIDVEGRLSTEDSRLQAWVILAEEGLQIAHECCQALAR